MKNWFKAATIILKQYFSRSSQDTPFCSEVQYPAEPPAIRKCCCNTHLQVQIVTRKSAHPATSSFLRHKWSLTPKEVSNAPRGGSGAVLRPFPSRPRPGRQLTRYYRDLGDESRRRVAGQAIISRRRNQPTALLSQSWCSELALGVMNASSAMR